MFISLFFLPSNSRNRDFVCSTLENCLAPIISNETCGGGATLIHLSAIEEATSISETSLSLSSWINSFTFYSLFIWLVQRKWKNTGLVRVVQLGPDPPEVPNLIVCPENNWFNWTCQINLMIMWLQIMFLFQGVVVVVGSKGKFSDFEFSRLKRILAFW